ncbi:serine hydrolase domain-containing protein [Brevibacterium jeotgali]|uniref:CubicO group peptidase, beta-lactamase class C family n=1 Tax=Brevibacterium jeotgali TaxID=1262550 RepID=A0A2H1L6Z1_9MICO|nr:serine hydrolase domain-containing protein [Brevibacterium jeotgali]TWC02280.1 CubicO group peptidase (beta-lactamase class C family) [Brevibacterium jeotgali]SMY12668.1 CubicO group peptidase, beta-lactamase class C family [Brevibacterium jeotgali]
MQSILHGTSTDQFDGLRSAFAANLETGEDLGGSLVINLDGENVVDLWGGYRDADRTVPWTSDTLVNVWSTTKTVTYLAALMLADQGEIDLHAPVATYWPEFSANGKADIEVRHLMAHTSGVSGWDAPFTLEDMYDWEKSTAALAAQAPWWQPGSAGGYHAQNQGHLIGEVVRRTTGLTFKQFVDEEIAGPLGADFQIGAREEDWGRISDVIPPPPLEIDPSIPADHPMIRTFTQPAADASAANTAAWRNADMGATNGHGNARSVARILSAISLGGEVDGMRLLSPDTIEQVFEVQTTGPDLVLGVPIRRGMGFALADPEAMPSLPEGRICYWGGWGGSVIIMDLDRRMTISYMMNKMGPGVVGSERSEQYLREIYRALP